MRIWDVLFINGKWRWGSSLVLYLLLVSVVIVAVLVLGSLAGVLSATTSVGWLPTIEATLLYPALHAAFRSLSGLRCG